MGRRPRHPWSHAAPTPPATRRVRHRADGPLDPRGYHLTTWLHYQRRKPDVTVGGGGPAGPSAPLFTAKNGLDTVVFDDDGTLMHEAHLFDYPGIGSLDGTAFVETARTQVDGFGVERRQGEAVTDVAATDGGFRVSADEGDHEADSLVLATGADRSLADPLGCAFDGDVVDVDVTMETSVDDAYATAPWCAERSGRRSSPPATAPPRR